MNQANDTGRDYVPRWGAIHIHTDYSDGNVSVDETIAAAQRAGLDFITVTDHNTLAARSAEGYHNDLLVQVDVEITPSAFGDHLLAFGLEEYDDLHRLPRSEFMEAVTAAGGFGWVPHPVGFYYPWLGIWNTRWRDWNEQVCGLDLSTYLVEWVGTLRPWNLFSKLRKHDDLPVFEPPRRVLQMWDHLNAQRPTTGFIGIDAHYRSRFGSWLRSPNYEELFGTHNVVAWTPPPTGDATTDLTELRRALRAGRFANVFANVGGRGSFEFQRDGNSIRVSAPDRDGTTIDIVRDGQTVTEVDGPEWSDASARPGVYRAEIRYRGALWALTNPIRVESSVPDAQEASGDRSGLSAR